VKRLGDTSMITEIWLDRDGTRVAEGELRHVFIETREGGTAPIPESIRSGLARFVAE
jgi:acyl-CoA thioesterase FadM